MARAKSLASEGEEPKIYTYEEYVNEFKPEEWLSKSLLVYGMYDDPAVLADKTQEEWVIEFDKHYNREFRMGV